MQQVAWAFAGLRHFLPLRLRACTAANSIKSRDPQAPFAGVRYATLRSVFLPHFLFGSARAARGRGHTALSGASAAKNGVGCK